MQFNLPPLPYEYSALEPYISAQTLGFHYDKHHMGYLNKLNSMIKEQGLSYDSLESLILDNNAGVLFNNAGQVWNHTFYWKSMTPKPQAPEKKLADLLNLSFGSYEGFRDKFVAATLSTFGSGWVWLVLRDGKLYLDSTSNADSPLSLNSGQALFTCDVWEHAYYLDTQNDRAAYARKFLDLINWQFASSNLI